MNSVFIFGSIQSLIFALLLILKKEKKKTDFILLIWFLYFALHLLFPAFVFYDYPAYISFSGIDVGLIAINVIFLDYYISSFSGLQRSLLLSLLLRSAVLAGSALFVIPYISMGAEKRTLLMTGQTGFPILMVSGGLILLATASFYLYSSKVKLGTYRKAIRQQLSNTDGLMMKWIDVMIVSFIAFFLTIVLFFLLMLITPMPPHIADYIVYAGLVLLVFWMGFSAIRQGAVFLSDLKTSDEKETLTSKKKPEQKEILFGKQVREFTEQQKIYLDNEIRMSQLAEMLSVSPQYLSFVLNSVIEMSFYDFINSYRIKEVCSRIESGDARELTILSLALESGFNSKATFNRFFKKQMGMNPSEYIKIRLK